MQNPYDISQLPLAMDKEIEPVQLIYHFSFNNLIELDSTGKFTFLANIGLSWKDVNRCWNPLKYPVEFLFVDSSEIWTPKFILINARSNELIIDPKNASSAFIDYNGDVTVKMHKKFEATCDLELGNFPFDRQECRLIFTLLQYTADEVSITRMPVVYESFLLKEGEWQLIKIMEGPKNFSVKVYNKTSEGMIILDPYEESKESINTGFEVLITFERHFEYYVNYIIVPVCLMALLGYLAVLLRVDSAERLNLSISVMLGFLFLQSTISPLVPKSGSFPLIGKFLLGCMIMQSTNVVFSASMMWVSQFQVPLPLWLQHQCRSISPMKILHALMIFKNQKRVRSRTESRPSEMELAHLNKSSSSLNQTKAPEEQESSQASISWPDLIVPANRFFGLIFLCTYFLMVKSYLFPILDAFREHKH